MLVNTVEGRLIIAFLVGGALCGIAQILIDKTKLTPARILVSYVVAGVILTGVGLYGHLVKFAGNGATTPLTGFGYCLAEGVKKAVDKDGLIGALTGGITGAAGGITAAIFMGISVALVFKSKPK
ncbi:MAG: stage V sporulation protein AE [Clostridia bacterium]|nr:stage V sporulation protein AE [Clostridia bacterium]